MPTDAPAAPISSAEGRAWLWAALLLSGALSALLILRSPCIGKDGPTFLWMAQGLERDFGATIRAADQHPGYPMLVLAAHRVARVLGAPEGNAAWALVGRLVSALFGALLVWAVWEAGRRLFDARAAGIAAALVAVLPAFSASASDVWSDTPHLFFHVLCAGLLIAGLQRRRWTWFLGAGLAGGLAFWIRPEGLTPVLAGGIVLVWRAASCPEVRRAALVGILCLAAGALALVLPYTAIKGKLTSKKDLTQIVRVPSVMDAPSNVPEGAGGAASGTGAVQSVPAAPPSRGTRVLAGLIRMADRVMHGLRYFLLIPILLALFHPRRRRVEAEGGRFAAVWALCMIALLTALFVVAGYLVERHVMPLIVLGALGSGAGLAWMGERLTSWVSGRWAKARRIRVEWVCALLAGVCVLALLPRSVRPPYGHTEPLRRACLWVRDRAAPGDAVLANTQWAPFYAELPGQGLPWDIPLWLELSNAPERRYRFIIFYRHQDGWRFHEDAALAAYRAIGAEEVSGLDGSVALYERRNAPAR